MATSRGLKTGNANVRDFSLFIDIWFYFRFHRRTNGTESGSRASVR